MTQTEPVPQTPKERRKARRKALGYVDAQDKPQAEQGKKPASKTARKK